MKSRLSRSLEHKGTPLLKENLPVPQAGQSPRYSCRALEQSVPGGATTQEKIAVEQRHKSENKSALAALFGHHSTRKERQTKEDCLEERDRLLD